MRTWNHESPARQRRKVVDQKHGVAGDRSLHDLVRSENLVLVHVLRQVARFGDQREECGDEKVVAEDFGEDLLDNGATLHGFGVELEYLSEEPVLSVLVEQRVNELRCGNLERTVWISQLVLSPQTESLRTHRLARRRRRGRERGDTSETFAIRLLVDSRTNCFQLRRRQCLGNKTIAPFHKVLPQLNEVLGRNRQILVRPVLFLPAFFRVVKQSRIVQVQARRRAIFQFINFILGDSEPAFRALVEVRAQKAGIRFERADEFRVRKLLFR